MQCEGIGQAILGNVERRGELEGNREIRVDLGEAVVDLLDHVPGRGQRLKLRVESAGVGLHAHAERAAHDDVGGIDRGGILREGGTEAGDARNSCRGGSAGHTGCAQHEAAAVQIAGDERAKRFLEMIFLGQLVLLAELTTIPTCRFCPSCFIADLGSQADYGRTRGL